MLRALSQQNSAFIHPRALLRGVLPQLICASAMLALTRADLLLHSSPLAAAWMAAALAVGRHPAPLVGACLLGILRLPLGETALLPAVSAVLLLIHALLRSILPFRARMELENRASLAAGLSVLLPAMVAAGGELLPSLQALSSAALAACASPFFCALLRKKRRRDMLSPAEKTGGALLVGGCVIALQSICPPAAQSLCALMVLLLPTPAASLLGTLALCAGGASLLQGASLFLCSAASDCALLTHKWQRALCAICVSMLTQLLAGSEVLQAQWMLCAAAIYILLPDHIIQRARQWILPRRVSDFEPLEVAREATRQTRRRLTALAEAFGVMAQGCQATPNVPDEQELIFEMRARLCSGCASFGECWAGEDDRAVRLLCGLIGDALRRLDAPMGQRTLFSDGEIPPDILRACRRGRLIGDRLGLLLRDFTEKRRAEIKRCSDDQRLSMQFSQAREILLRLARFQPEAPSQAQLRAALMSVGLNDCVAVANSSNAASITLLRQEGCWTKGEISRAGRALSRTLGGKYLPRLENGLLCFARAPRLSAESGTSCQSGVAGEVSGDNHMVRFLREDKLLLVISDGMGSGEAACRESRAALELLWSFLDAGICRDLALETVNLQLLCSSGEDMFATLDLCVIDLNTGVAEFCKLAASPTLILRGRELTHIGGGRLPLGILENVQPSVRRVRLRPGDMLVMGSDGVMEAGDGMAIERYARENAAMPPEQLAQNLIRQAALQRSEGRLDDMTCICVRLGARGAC